MRCATPSPWPAASIPNASSPCSDVAAIATAPSVPSSAMPPPKPRLSSSSPPSTRASDTPRSEDPLAIMNDALVGIRRSDVPHLVEPDRAAAIARPLKEAREGDIVILAGKGHEPYQVLKDHTIPFDDRAVAREVLKGYGYTTTS